MEQQFVGLPAQLPGEPAPRLRPGTKALERRIAQGDDPSIFWSWSGRGLRPGAAAGHVDSATYSDLAALPASTLCAAVVLNSVEHPIVTALSGAHALEGASLRTRMRDAFTSEKLRGAFSQRRSACAAT